ncbi:MAG: PQQ-binding-like beta-propeller repeat protein, partial [Gammaproteobacteria bacterium]|nr:PQQ-binding-like beta-propeller repeat protein [Gammaproteobacteria bacterium]
MMAAGQVGADPWPHYGGHLDGRRYVSSTILTPENTQDLKQAWVFRTGDVANGGDEYFGRTSSFKATPILIDGKLVFSSGFNRVYAINPVTGKELWRFDPGVNFARRYSEMFTSRGVAGWVDRQADRNSICASRIFLGTLDARLIAIDARSGKKCSAFGEQGAIDLSKGIRNFRRGEYSLTSPPTIVKGLVIVGSSIGDNGGAQMESGTVRAFDARTGELRWAFDPIPRDPDSPGWSTWKGKSALQTGAANVWGVMAADPGRDLVFLPTTSPSPDFYGGERLGDNAYANSIVALRASTGEFVWAYQLVRHDLWDYDLAAQPMLVDIDRAGESVPALLQATKMGFVFVLDRRTGKPLNSVEERPVPASAVPGEIAAKAQKFPMLKLHAFSDELPPIWQHSPEHVEACRNMLEGVRFEGIYTPPSLAGTLLYPGNPGGVNWGSMAAHERRGLAFVVVNRLPTVVKVIPRRQFRKQSNDGVFNGVEAQFTSQSGTPYGMARFELFNRANTLPCLEGPWATLVAI